MMTVMMTMMMTDPAQVMPGYSTLGTDELHGTDHETTHWFNMGGCIMIICVSAM